MNTNPRNFVNIVAERNSQPGWLYTSLGMLRSENGTNARTNVARDRHLRGRDICEQSRQNITGVKGMGENV